MSLTSDNGSNVRKALEEDLNMPRHACDAHTLGSAHSRALGLVKNKQGGATAKSINPQVLKVLRKCAKMNKKARTPDGKRIFGGYCKTHNVKNPETVSFVVTRWSSYHAMLVRVLEQEKAWLSWAVADPGKFRGCKPNDRLFRVLEQMCSILDESARFHTLCQNPAFNFGSAHLQKQMIIANLKEDTKIKARNLNLDKAELTEAELEEEPRLMRIMLREELERRWATMSSTQLRAMATDIRTNELPDCSVRERIDTELFIEAMIDKVNTDMGGPPSPVRPVQSVAAASTSDAALLLRMGKRPRATEQTELEQFKADDNYPVTNILEHDNCAWWHKHKAKYPKLSLVALAMGAAMPTSAGAERDFSQAGLFLSPLKSGLNPKTVEVRMMLKKNSEYRPEQKNIPILSRQAAAAAMPGWCSEGELAQASLQ